MTVKTCYASLLVLIIKTILVESTRVPVVRRHHNNDTKALICKIYNINSNKLMILTHLFNIFM